MILHGCHFADYTSKVLHSNAFNKSKTNKQTNKSEVFVLNFMYLPRKRQRRSKPTRSFLLDNAGPVISMSFFPVTFSIPIPAAARLLLLSVSLSWRSALETGTPALCVPNLSNMTIGCGWKLGVKNLLAPNTQERTRTTHVQSCGETVSNPTSWHSIMFPRVASLSKYSFLRIF